MKFGKRFGGTRRLPVSRGFSLSEMAVATLIFSAIGIAIFGFLRKQSDGLSKSDLNGSIRSIGNLTEKLLSDDLKQVVFVNPSCATNQSSSAATVSCANIKIRGGIMPLPGKSMQDLDAEADLGLPDNLTDDASLLNFGSDALRLVEYNYTGRFGCRLNPRHSGANPSTSAERFWIQRSSCLNTDGSVRVQNGGLYLLLESFGSVNPLIFSNIFQLTSAPIDQGAMLDDIQVDVVSGQINYFNQNSPMSNSGFTSAARMFPVKIVEWAVGVEGGLYRREFIPSAANTLGSGEWTLMEKQVESMQLTYLTASTTQAWSHSRTVSWTNDAENNGVEDIRGVTPWFVIKGDQPSREVSSVDNPQTALVESDGHCRSDFKFFVDLRNFSN